MFNKTYIVEPKNIILMSLMQDCQVASLKTTIQNFFQAQIILIYNQ